MVGGKALAHAGWRIHVDLDRHSGIAALQALPEGGRVDHREVDVAARISGAAHHASRGHNPHRCEFCQHEGHRRMQRLGIGFRQGRPSAVAQLHIRTLLHKGPHRPKHAAKKRCKKDAAKKRPKEHLALRHSLTTPRHPRRRGDRLIAYGERVASVNVRTRRGASVREQGGVLGSTQLGVDVLQELCAAIIGKSLDRQLVQTLRLLGQALPGLAPLRGALREVVEQVARIARLDNGCL